MLIEKSYIQKSKLFLLPLIEVKRDPNIIPISTYIADIQKELTLEDKKLILPFERDESSEFSFYEKHLVNSNYFDTENYYETTKYRVYIYKLDEFADDFNLFIEGKYTKFSSRIKTLINLYWGTTRGGRFMPHSKIEAYLSPTKDHYHKVAEELNVDVKDIIKVKELIAPPDLEKETFYNKASIGNKSKEVN